MIYAYDFTIFLKMVNLRDLCYHSDCPFQATCILLDLMLDLLIVYKVSNSAVSSHASLYSCLIVIPNFHLWYLATGYQLLVYAQLKKNFVIYMLKIGNQSLFKKRCH